MSKRIVKLETDTAIMHHAFDYHYQTYRVELELLDCTKENILEWERFFLQLNDSKYNVAKLTIEKIEDE